MIPAPALLTVAPSGLATGSSTKPWLKKRTPIRFGAFGNGHASVARPAATGVKKTISGLACSVQPVMPIAPRPYGSVLPFHCAFEKPNEIVAALLGMPSSSSWNVAPTIGRDPPTGRSSGTPDVPWHPLPNVVHRAMVPGTYSHVSLKFELLVVLDRPPNSTVRPRRRSCASE